MQIEAAYLISAITAVLAGAGGVIAYLFHTLIAAKDREHALIIKEKERILTDLEGMKKSYQEIAVESLKSNKDMLNFYRAKEGKPPAIFVPPVVSESQSPSTAAQRETAAIQTMRATLAQIKRETGQEPREEPEHAQEPLPPPKPHEPPPPIRVTLVPDPKQDPQPVTSVEPKTKPESAAKEP